ncbi:MAG: caspase family protein, partial [Desulfobacterales bacterium]
MKRAVIAVCVLFLMFSFPSPSFAARSRGLTVTTDPGSALNGWGNYYALIIGIDAYKEWNPLRTAVKDATALRDVLVQQYGFKKKNVVLLTDEQASRSRITMALRNLAAGLDQTDNLLIYYAGHGQIDDLTGDGYWIPAEGKLKDPSTWIAHSMVKNLLSSDSVHAKNVILVADACYSGTLLREGPSMLSIDRSDYMNKLREAASKPSRQVITSGGMEPVADGGRDGHSLFAYYFLKALRENDREVVDLENLFHTRVWGPVTQVGDQRPNVGRLKTPMDEDGQFVLTNVIRAQQVDALKTAETQQATQQQNQLAALMAEKERIDAELKRLELEKQVMEEKRKLEGERRKIEEQKRQLEKDRLAIEQERAASEKPAAGAPAAASAEGPAQAMQVAAISPSVRDAGKLSLAIFPWKVASSLYVFNDHSYVKSVEAAFQENQRVDIQYSFQPPLSSRKGIKPLPMKQEEFESLWQKKSVLSPYEPDSEKVFQTAEKAGVDTAVTCYIGMSDSGWLFRLFLFDVRNQKIYSKDKTLDTSHGYRGMIETGWQELFNEYWDARQEGKRLQAGQKPREPQKDASAPSAGGGSIQTAALTVPTPRPDSGLPLRIALMPWKMNPPGYAPDINLYSTSSVVWRTVAEDNRFLVSHSYFDYKPPDGANAHPISPLKITQQEADALWQKDGFFSSLKPNISETQRLAKDFGFDLALFINCYSDQNSTFVIVTTVDIASGQAIVSDKEI